MNFKQKSGIYDAKTDELIMDWNSAIRKDIIIDGTKASEYKYRLSTPENIAKTEVIVSLRETFEKPFYIILPNYILALNDCCFQGHKNLIGISGKNVQSAYIFAFRYSDNLEEIDLPNLKFFESNIFPSSSSPFMKKYRKEENGLITVKENLVGFDERKLKNETLIIPEEIKAIKADLFSEKYSCPNIKNVVLPTKLSTCAFQLHNGIDNFVLPIEFSTLNISFVSGPVNIVYKGTKERLKKMTGLTEKEISEKTGIEIKPYTIKELQDLNYSIEKVEFILDRKLTLDEIIELGKPFKEVNNYLKDVER